MSGKEPRFHGEVTDRSHKNMSKIRAKDTSIEVALRKALWSKGYRYRKNYKDLPGRPDIVLTKYKIAIFCDSEFFHGKDWDALKKKLEKGKNPDYWIKKIERNIQRDKEKDLLCSPIFSTATNLSCLTGSSICYDRIPKFLRSVYP